ncbi:hypothetical protein Poly30_32920 [Planctomycetes bacterium Poly30]|uniref:Uncharacterized protein n=1 Tax=Saltatorellus ferox TaxID=2528018 RepID=A0A518EUJ2_9BACT|nr:hypothetical protein Poly30_32920 [Planctomycetes bacterium Poly30]
MQSNTNGLLLACLPIGLLAACSSGSDSDPSPGSISSLLAPEGVSVVDPDTSAVSTGNGSFPNAGNQFPVNSDYVTDAASVRVIDPSIEAVDQANSILCQVGLTRFWRFVNEAPYRAQLDTALCGEEPDISESGTVTPRIHVFSMDVNRASNAEPQLASLWLPIDENGSPAMIHGELEVSASPSQGDRYGAFELRYVGIPDGGTAADALMYGMLKSEEGDNGFLFLEGSGDIDVPATNPGDYAERSQMVLTFNTGSGGGAAKITRTVRYHDGIGDSGALESTWRVVFDAANVVRQLDTDPAVALSRGDYENHVFRYNLYHNQGADIGQRVELSSGISVELDSGQYGWVGYYGAWAPLGESFENGDQVTAETESGDVIYDVVAAPGKLRRVTRDTLLLSELGTQRFEWWEGPSRFQIAYSGTEWQRLAEWNGSTESWDPIIPPTLIDVTAAGGFISMHSQYLGGVNYEDGDTEITFFTDRVVLGSDPVFSGLTELELYATVNGLKSEISLSDANAGSVYLPNANDVASAYRYEFDPSDMTLRLDSGSGVMVGVGLAAGVEPDQGPNTWGMQSGPLVTAAQRTAMTSIYDVFNEDEFYFYETGHNEWNKFIGLTDAGGDFLEFDPPLDVLYTHSTANDMNDDPTYDGQQILLNYNGPGRLFGIPGSPVDLGGEGQWWFPNFSLKDGTVIGANSEYIVRALGVEQTLVVDPGGATQLDITDADALVVPELSLYVMPAITVPPTITGPPAVVDGVIQ